MASYNELISRENADVLVPQPIANEIMKEVPQFSAALSLCRTRNMGTKTERMPVIAALPTAAFGTGDSGISQTTHAEWKNKELIAEPVSCIIPIPEDVLDDTSMPLWDEVKPLGAEAIGIALDKAVFMNIGAPTTWTDAGIASKATAAGNEVYRGANAQNAGGIYKDLIDLMFLVQGQGYKCTGMAADDMFEQQLLSATDTQGRPLVDWNQAQTRCLGRNLAYSGSGVWTPGAGVPELITGNFDKAIVGIRQDIRIKVLDQAVITDDEGRVVLNLATQRMKALLMVARFAFVVANNATRKKQGDDVRYPFGVLRSPD